MELSSKKPCSDHQKKRLVATGVGVGVVILLGGAFAVASAFIAGRKGRSSAVNGDERKLQNDEPESDGPDYKKEVEIVLNDKPSSDEVTKEIVEFDHGSLASSHTLKPDATDAEKTSEKTLDSISRNEQEKKSSSDGSAVEKENFGFLGDHKLPSEPEDVMQGTEMLIAEKVSDEISRERKDSDNGGDGEQNVDGEIEDHELPSESENVMAEMETLTEKASGEVSREREDIDDGKRDGEQNEDGGEVSCDQELSALTSVHKALHELHVDEMEVENNRGVDMNMNGGLGGRSGDNGDIGDVKSETNEEKESDSVAENQAVQDDGQVTTAMASASEGVHIDQIEAQDNLSKEVGNEDTRETTAFDSHIEDGKETFQPMIDSHAIENNNVESDKKICHVPNEMVSLSQEVIAGSPEVIQENNITEEDLEVRSKRVDEDIVKEEKEETCKEAGLVDEADHIFPDPGLHIEPNEEHSGITNATPENPELGDHDKNVDSLHMPVLEKEMISPEGIKVTADEEVELEVNDKDAIPEQVVCQQKDCDDGAEQTIGKEAEAESTNVTTEKSEDEEKGDEVNIMETDDDEVDEMDSSEVEESSIETRDSSTESNTEEAWPVYSVQPMDQEVDRKTLEDKTFGKQNGFNNKSIEIKEEIDSAVTKQIIHSFEGSNIREPTQNSIKKYFMELGTLVYHPGNAKVLMMLIVTLSLLSSYLCSRIFDCSFVKLSLIMFFTMALSRIRSY